VSRGAARRARRALVPPRAALAVVGLFAAAALAWVTGLMVMLALAPRTGHAATGVVTAPDVSAPTVLDFTPEELQRIQSHGPWPLPLPRDAGNALSGRTEAQALGRALFFERGLSPAGVSCAHCHDPARAFTDGRARSVGVAELDRNAPTLLDAAHERWLGWDGAADSLWGQSIRPLLDAREMASSPAHLKRAVASQPALAAAWRRTFGQDVVTQDEEAVLVGVAQAMGAWTATLASGRTPFDDFRDALARGDRAAAARYPLSAQRGLRTFVGTGNCHLCHVGPRFTHGEFADIGLPFFVRPGIVDPGRHGGIESLKASRYTLLSKWSMATQEESVKTRHVEAAHRNFGEFKVPSLRGVAQTAPYMHDGQVPTLHAVVRHYSRLNPERLHADGEQLLRPLGLTPQEEDDLVAFLRTLSPREAAPSSAAAGGAVRPAAAAAVSPAAPRPPSATGPPARSSTR